MENKIFDVVFLLPVTEEGILLFKNKESGYWELPAGPPNNSESSCGAVMRIFYQQTSNMVKEVQFIGEKEFMFEGKEQAMAMAYYLGFIQEPLVEVKSKIFDDFMVYDEMNPPDPICSTCKMIINAYKAYK